MYIDAPKDIYVMLAYFLTDIVSVSYLVTTPVLLNLAYPINGGPCLSQVIRQATDVFDTCECFCYLTLLAESHALLLPNQGTNLGQ